jgi:putative endonuclease
MYKIIYLYILKCSDGSLYVGVTNNPERRLIEHNLGINTESYTYSRRPVEIVFHEMFTDFNLAFEWETKIKKWSRAKKQVLIDGDFESLKELSKKKFKEKPQSPSEE